MNSSWEIVGVCSSLAYLILAMRENRNCFVLGFISSCIFSYLFSTTKLYMETGLQIYYGLLSIYGWHHWKNGNKNKEELKITSWTLNKHIAAFSITLILSSVSMILLSIFTKASYPFFDSFVTWGSLLTTYMVTRKILENWLYWVVLDAIGMCLYFNKGLYITAGLFSTYVVLSILGYFRWLKSYQSTSNISPELNSLNLDTEAQGG